MRLDPEHRQRAASELDLALACRADLPPGSIPIDDLRWERFVSRLQNLASSVAEIAGTVEAAVSSGEFKDVSAASKEAAGLLLKADAVIRPGSMFYHPRRSDLVRMHDFVGEVARGWLGSLIGTPATVSDAANDQPRESPDVAQAFTEALRDLRPLEDGPPQDPWASVFGVDRAELCDANGAFSTSLLVAQFHSRLGDLQSRVDRLFEPLGPAKLDPLKALTFCPVLLESVDPAESVQAALHVYELVIERFHAEPDHTAIVLRAMLDNVERSHANMTMIRDTVARLEATTRRDRRAMLILELYRRMTEGQMKPWCWALVCLHTGAHGPAPMLSQLGDRLRATCDDLAVALANCIVAKPRNAAAHEDYHWDSGRRRLMSGTDEIDPEQLKHLSVRGQGLVLGAELGWALACATTPRLTDSTRSVGGQEFAAVLQINDALTRFSTNNLRVEDWELDLDELTIYIADLGPDEFNPCAQAILEASLVFPEAQRFAVRLPAIDGPAMVASRPVLLNILPLWFTARRRYEKMPPAVFLPLFFESRLLVEPPDVAAGSMVWLALNEAAHFLGTFHAAQLVGKLPVAADLAHLSVGLTIVSRTLEICALACHEKTEFLLGRSYRAIRGAATHAGCASSDLPNRSGLDSLRSLDRLGDKIFELLEALPACAPLPTVDRSPLSVSNP